MYRDRESGQKVYENLNELLRAPVEWVKEAGDFYHVRLKGTGPYDETVWKVNKSTGEVTCIHLTEFFEVEDQSVELDPAVLRKSIKCAR